MSEFRFYANYGYRTPRARRRKKAEPRRRLKLLRVSADIRMDERVVPSRVLLNDIFPRAIFVFSPEPISPGSVIAVTIEAPKQFYGVGRVVSCHAYRRNSRVIESAEFPYRVAVAFEFDSEADAQEVRDYVEDLRARFLFK